MGPPSLPKMSPGLLKPWSVRVILSTGSITARSRRPRRWMPRGYGLLSANRTTVSCPSSWVNCRSCPNTTGRPGTLAPRHWNPHWAAGLTRSANLRRGVLRSGSALKTTGAGISRYAGGCRISRRSGPTSSVMQRRSAWRSKPAILIIDWRIRRRPGQKTTTSRLSRKAG